MRPALLAVLFTVGCGGTSPPGEGSAQPSIASGAPATTDSCPGVSADATARMQAVLRDPEDRFKGAYPPAPALTCPILQGLAGELADPSVRSRYEAMSAEHWEDHPSWAGTMESLGRDSRRYTLIALGTHWNTDQKILALRALQRVPSRLLINATADVEAKLAATEREALRFLLHVFETTPLAISGSENAAIHGVYMDALVGTLDLLSGERGAGGGLRTRHMNETERTAAIASWRRHVGP